MTFTFVVLVCVVAVSDDAFFTLPARSHPPKSPHQCHQFRNTLPDSSRDECEREIQVFREVMAKSLAQTADRSNIVFSFGAECRPNP